MSGPRPAAGMCGFFVVLFSAVWLFLFEESVMHYFVTRATGFIGKRLVRKLLERKGAVVHFLIRRESEDKVAGLREFWGVGAARAIPVFGDLTSKKLGVSADDVKSLKGKVDHFHH